MEVSSLTDVGKSRANNQDSLYVSKESVGKLPNLFIVADGMGGHRAGDTASRLCVSSAVESITKSGFFGPKAAFETAISYSNACVFAKSHESEDYSGMGTTLVMCTISEDNLSVANIGDSRLYLVGKKMKQITKDHSLVAEMVEAGTITKEQAKNHKDKNIITRALGINPTVLADYFNVKVKSTERVLMCSDGLTNMLTDKEIVEIVNSSISLEEKVQALVDLANEKGGKDNISVVIIEP